MNADDRLTSSCCISTLNCTVIVQYRVCVEPYISCFIYLSSRVLLGCIRDDSCGDGCGERCDDMCGDSCDDGSGDSCGDVCGDSCGDGCGDGCCHECGDRYGAIEYNLIICILQIQN